MPETLFTTHEAAVALHCSDSHVRNLAARGGLRVAFFTQRRRMLFRSADVEAMRREREGRKVA